MRYNVESSGVAGYSDSRRVEMRQRVKRFGVGKSAESGLGMSVMHKLKSPIYSAVGKRYEALPVHGLGVVGWECGWRDPEKS